jgi:hypothetical protein
VTNTEPKNRCLGTLILALPVATGEDLPNLGLMWQEVFGSMTTLVGKKIILCARFYSQGRLSTRSCTPMIVQSYDPLAPCLLLIGGAGIVIGGGDTFDCYDVQFDILTLPLAGKNFSGAWVIGRNYNLGLDDYELYSVQNPITETLALGYGFTDAWLIGRNCNIGLDDYESYAVQNPITQTLEAGFGFTGAWILGERAPCQDTFEEYTVENPLTQTLNGGSGYTDPWIVGNGP